MARPLHPLLDSAGQLADALSDQLLVGHSRHLNVDADPVEQQPGDELLVLGDRADRAGAGIDLVAIVAARAGVRTVNVILGFQK